MHPTVFTYILMFCLVSMYYQKYTTECKNGEKKCNFCSLNPKCSAAISHCEYVAPLLWVINCDHDLNEFEDLGPLSLFL